VKHYKKPMGTKINNDLTALCFFSIALAIQKATLQTGSIAKNVYHPFFRRPALLQLIVSLFFELRSTSRAPLKIKKDVSK